MRLLITGGSSYLGQHLVPLALADPAVSQLTYTYFTHDPLGLPNGVRLDVRDATAVADLIASVQPQAIIHTVGSNRVDPLEEVIVAGTRHLVTAAPHSRFIHLSSDVVFNGLDAPYNEQSPPTPIHAYGRAKAHAENIVSQHANHVIIRTSLIYSLRLMDMGTQWMASALQAGQAITLFSDQYRNPVWADSLSLACLELATKHRYCGILNVAGRQKMSRADFAQKMLAWWGIPIGENITIAPTPSAQWPPDCELDISRAEAILQTPLLGVDELLRTSKPLSSPLS